MPSNTFLPFSVAMVGSGQSPSLGKASLSHPPQGCSTKNYHFYFMQANASYIWHFFLKQTENNNNVLGLAILKSPPPQKKNHLVQTTSRPTLSGKSRFRKKGDTIDSTTYKKENRASQPGPLWDAAGCWLTSQLWSLLSSGRSKQPFMPWARRKQTSPGHALLLCN